MPNNVPQSFKPWRSTNITSSPLDINAMTALVPARVRFFLQIKWSGYILEQSCHLQTESPLVVGIN